MKDKQIGILRISKKFKMFKKKTPLKVFSLTFKSSFEKYYQTSFYVLKTLKVFLCLEILLRSIVKLTLNVHNYNPLSPHMLKVSLTLFLVITLDGIENNMCTGPECKLMSILNTHFIPIL